MFFSQAQDDREGLVKCNYEDDIARFALNKNTTLEELIGMVECEWGIGKGLKFQDEDGDWVKMRRNEDVAEVWNQTETKNVTLRVFSKEQVNYVFDSSNDFFHFFRF